VWVGSRTVQRDRGQLTLSHPSPNFGARRDGARPDMVVIHYTAMQSAEAACRALCNPDREVSAHYLIAENGHVMSLVAEEMRAWHAGAGAWGDVTDVNSRSIGIELANDGFSPFAAPQMAALETLLADINTRWAIQPERVIGHSDMAPGRKIDPGLRFDWQRLARCGLSVWWDGYPQPDQDISLAGFRAAARAFGYADVADDLLLATFRRRFRPWGCGALDPWDCHIAAQLAQRFPVDGFAAKA